jgi:hypothetical protein
LRRLHEPVRELIEASKALCEESRRITQESRKARQRVCQKFPLSNPEPPLFITRSLRADTVSTYSRLPPPSKERVRLTLWTSTTSL